jgi:competence protein ComFB
MIRIVGCAVNYSSVNNFYENLVFDYISTELSNRYSDSNEDFFLDVACYALTRLPSRYICHEVDMAYYLAPGEREEMIKCVKEEVNKAAEFIYAQ